MQTKAKQPNNVENLELFQSHVQNSLWTIQTQYHQLLVRDLSQQHSQGCLHRNVLTVLEQVYDDAFKLLQTLQFDSSQFSIEHDHHQLTLQLLAAFHGYNEEFLKFAVSKHRSSCALSNFPSEHKPDNQYINAVNADISILWQNLAARINTYMQAFR